MATAKKALKKKAAPKKEITVQLTLNGKIITGETIIEIDYPGRFFFIQIPYHCNAGGRHSGSFSFGNAPDIQSVTVSVQQESLRVPDNEAMCMVRTVIKGPSWIEFCFEIFDFPHWRDTGELKPWVKPIKLLTSMHGRFNKPKPITKVKK